MSEPIKKPGKTPESYSPKKPEIATMVKEVQDSVMQESVTEPKLEKFEVVKWEPRRFIGKSVYVRAIMDTRDPTVFHSGTICGALWEQSDWIFKALDGLKEYATDDFHNVGLTTWERYEGKNQLFGYTVGRFMKADTPVPDFMDYIDIPEIYVAKGTKSGKIDLVSKWSTGEYLCIVGCDECWIYDEAGRQGYDRASGIFVAEAYPELPDENGNISVWENWGACKLRNPPQA